MNQTNKCPIFIDTEEVANQAIDRILEEKESLPIIGIDCEASIEMSRFGVLCLMQVR